MKFKLIQVAVVCLMLSICNLAKATIIWDWELTNNTQLVGSTENVVLNGRLYNNTTDGEVFGKLDSGADWIFTGSSHQLIPGYDIVQHTNLTSVLNFNLAAGDSVDFIAAEYDPEGALPFGYYSGSISLSFAKEGFIDLGPIQRCFEWNVDRVSDDSCASHAVPEPSTIFLFGAGLIGALLRRKLGA